MSTAKHTPKAWDMYRDARGILYAVELVDNDQMVHVHSADGTWGKYDLKRVKYDKFVGNVLALPELLDACREVSHILYTLVKYLPDHPHPLGHVTDGQKALSAALAKADPAAQARADHAAVCKELEENR